MRQSIVCLLLAASLLMAARPANAQPILSGPTCVLPGTTYQYLIQGTWDSSSTMQICVNGGTIVPLNASCSGNGSPVSAILVIWSTGDSAPSINVTSSKGNPSLIVTPTTPLQAGTILDSSKTQSIGFDSAAPTIYCGPDSGGSCNPVYVHQWQQSQDQVNWTDITNATGQNLMLVPAQHQTIFFRRKTTETVSGSIAYSGAAAVMVGAPPPGTSAAAMN